MLSRDHPPAFDDILSILGGPLPTPCGPTFRALHWLERAVDYASAGGFALLRALSEIFLGRALSLAGRHSEAIAVLQNAVAGAESIQFTVAHGLTLAWLGDAHRRAGSAVDALTTVDQALAESRRHWQRAAEAEALLTLAAIHATRRPPDPDAARLAAGYALSLAGELRARPLVARAHLALGRLAEEPGASERATEHLAIAAHMFGEMAMSYWLEEAVAAGPRAG